MNTAVSNKINSLNVTQATQSVSFTDQLLHLGRCAAHKGASQPLIEYAQKQTRKYVAVPNSLDLTTHDKKRISAYFWAIIRKKALTRNDSQQINQRVVLNTFVKTLKSQGRSGKDIAEQLVKNYAHYAQQSVLEEYLAALAS